MAGQLPRRWQFYVVLATALTGGFNRKHRWVAPGAKICPKMPQNGPKMTQSGPNMTPNGPRWPKMAQEYFPVWSIFNLIQGNCLLQKSAHLNLTRECRMIATGVQTFAQIVRNEIFQFLVKLKSALHHLQGKRQ